MTNPFFLDLGHGSVGGVGATEMREAEDENRDQIRKWLPPEIIPVIEEAEKTGAGSRGVQGDAEKD